MNAYILCSIFQTHYFLPYFHYSIIFLCIFIFELKSKAFEQNNANKYFQYSCMTKKNSENFYNKKQYWDFAGHDSRISGIQDTSSRQHIFEVKTGQRILAYFFNSTATLQCND